MPTAAHGREVIIEFIQIGNAVKVTAFDVDRMLEVSIVGSPTVGEESLKRTVLSKLDYVLARGGRDRATRT